MEHRFQKKSSLLRNLKDQDETDLKSYISKKDAVT
eukprot:CAMPEP_0116933640 /NCGR_PEP_ID=MMETSP0467-20121206/29167_1 /TAXON_ID=283647 /ORGANISM="Mesodinium pulex, Strain SPMC105" /LENGTH=34 /DNA_ID= /DNA_START= /DNA_END= /DNA_ORIENTATION=